MMRLRELGPLVAALATCAVPFAAPATSHAGTYTMDQLWPNQNGRAWTYDQRYQELGTVPSVTDNVIRLIFEGPTIAPTGIECQYLRHQLISGPAAPGVLAGHIANPFMRNLWIARPDLRAAIESMPLGLTCPENAPPGIHAVLLNGEFAFRKSATETAAWRCNLADTRSWQWLESDVTLFHVFEIPLVPDLAGDVFLRGTVSAVEDIEVPAGFYPGCVRVNYSVDYGETVCVDLEGNPTGTAHAKTIGYVHFAPDEGPIQSFEEFIPHSEVTGVCEPWATGQPLTRTHLQLMSPSVPVKSTSWGTLKVLYR